jgi:hypothetical protein
VAVVFNIYDEETGTLIPSTDMNLHITFAGEYSNKQFGFNFTGNNSYEICIDPADAEYTINALIEFESDEYAHRKYFLFDEIINNVSSNVSLYLLNDTIGSDITLSIYDQSNGQQLENAIVKVLRYFPETDNGGTSGYKLVEVLQTNRDGTGLAELVVADVLGNSTSIDVSEYFIEESGAEDVRPNVVGFINSISVSDRINMLIAFVILVLLCIEVYVYWKKGKLKDITNDLFALGFWWLLLVVGVTTGFVGFVN